MKHKATKPIRSKSVFTTGVVVLVLFMLLLPIVVTPAKQLSSIFQSSDALADHGGAHRCSGTEMVQQRDENGDIIWLTVEDMQPCQMPDRCSAVYGSTANIGEACDPNEQNKSVWDWMFGGVSVIGAFAIDAVASFFNVITYLIFRFLGVVLWLVTTIFGVFIRFTLLPLRDMPIIAQGWTMSRNIVNLVLLLIWTVMAIGTILRLQSFNARQILPALLIIAILINFSFLIAGFLIDISNLIAIQFLNAAGGGNDLTDDAQFWGWINGFTGSIMNGLKSQSLIQGVENSVEMSTAAAFERQSDVAVSQMFNILFLMGIIMTLTVLAVMLLIRMLSITFLVILMPLAWVAYILPNTRNLWSQWWREFNKWLIFFPAFAFFLWLATTLASQLATNSVAGLSNLAQDPELQNQVAGIGNIAATSANISDPTKFIQYLVMLGFLLGSVLVSSKIGVMGAAHAEKFVRGGYSWAGRKASSETRRAARRFGERTGVSEKIRSIRTSSRLPTWAGGKRAVEYEKRLKEREKEAQAKLPESSDTIKKEIARRGTTAEVKMQGLKRLAEMGSLDNATIARHQKLLNQMLEPDGVYAGRASRTGIDKAILAARPDAGGNLNQNLERTINGENTGKINKEFFDDSANAAAFSNTATRMNADEAFRNLNRGQANSLNATLSANSGLRDSIIDSIRINPQMMEAVFQKINIAADHFAEGIETSATEFETVIRDADTAGELPNIIDTLSKSNKRALAAIQSKITAMGSNAYQRIDQLETTFGTDTAQRIITNRNINIDSKTGSGDGSGGAGGSGSGGAGGSGSGGSSSRQRRRPSPGPTSPPGFQTTQTPGP